MIKQLFTICSLFLFSTTVFGQNSTIAPFSNKPAKQTVQIHKTVLTLDDINANYENGTVGERCLQHSVTEARMESNLAYRQGVEEARQITNQIVREFESGERNAAATVYTVPIVFHVIHKGEAVGSGTNISSAQIQSAVDAMNRDYRRTSANGGVGQGAGPDIEVQFCLAGVDPQGNPHSGINRVNGTTVSGYSGSGITSSNEETVKALSKWDNRYYMNVWVVSEIENNGADVANPDNFSGGVLGYAYIPQSPITAMSAYDGIVALNLCVGNDPNGSLGYRLWFATTLNRTLTHEAGHFLGISHVFNDNNPNTCADGDGFADTPNAKQVSSNSCSYPSACTNQMIENYMDYTNDVCQNRFTENQKTYMRGVLTGVRTLLVQTSNCGISTNFDAAISAISTPSGSLCQTSFTPVVTLNNYGATTLTSVQIQYFVDALTPATYNWTGSLASNNSVNVTLNSVSTTTGAHTFTARTVTNTLNGSNTDQVTSNNQTVTNFSVATGGSAVNLTLNVDCWGSEVTWDIKNSSNTVVASGGPYTDNASGEQFIQSFCLAQGCYDFTIYDSQGDGMYGTQWSGCTVNGNYTITDGSNTLVQMTAQNAAYGASATHNFCIGGGGTTVVCDDLVEFDGQYFYVNDTDAPNFAAQLFDVDAQTLASTLTAAGWTSDWMGFYEIVAPGDTNFFYRAASWFVNATVPANNWITFGPITMPSDGGTLTWNHRFGDNDYRDGYSVLLNTTGTAVANFTGATTLRTYADNAVSTDGDTTWTAQTVSLPSNPYAFQSIYIGFRHTGLDQFFLDLDDIIVEGCSSITVDVSETEQFDLRVYPNPSSDNFTFSYSSDVSSKLDFRMLNSLGQEVWNYQTSGQTAGTHQIDTRGLATGIYTLVVKGDRLNVSERLILTK
ncbi:MAG: T9SS type A sorting domain-containing protein [Flavobacteriales bacterium]|nr:T9SS type A sorting domain-containing protein [Flavobacteriales bacterium]